MGITATPSASLPPVANSNAPTAAASASQADETAPTGFAALLAQLSSGQITAPQVIVGEISNADKTEKDSATEQDLLNPLLTSDSSGITPNVLPFLPPPPTSNLPPEFDPAGEQGNTGNSALLGLGLADSPQKPVTAAVSNLLAPTPDQPAIATSVTELLPTRVSPRPEPASILAEKPETLFKLAETANIAVENTPSEPTANSFASTLSALTATHAPRDTRATESAHIPTPLHNQAWGSALGDKVVWFAKNDVQSAQISINPPQLGPMQISLTLNGDQASAVFTSAHAEVRQAIESAMPHLREMLSASGITLGDASVGAQLPQQQRETQQHFANGNRSTGENAILPADNGTDTLSGTMPIQRGRGLVDLFA